MNDERYLKDLCPSNQVKSLIEKERIIDIRDVKWMHPAAADNSIAWYDENMGGASYLYNADVPQEEKIKQGKEIQESVRSLTTNGEKTEESLCDIATYIVPGCPEEPETEVEVRVYRPRMLKKRKARCMFYCIGGALVLVSPESFPIEELANRYKCVIVTAIYRKSYIAKYPAAINDLHAGYQWMIEHAEELGIHPDNIVLHGTSSGGHLALALGFRLKRYGYSPKGIVACVPQTDDREDDSVSIYNGIWDSINQHDALAQWLGRDFGSNRVGPEALANHATVKDCIGYPPTFIHTVEFDPDRNFSRAFYGKLLEARTFAEFHCWGGGQHGTPWEGVVMNGELNEYTSRVRAVFDGNIEDCFKYDLRRPWVKEEV